MQTLGGRPMVSWVVERFARQVSELLINANQNSERYAALGYRVIPDLIPGFAGPLAGLHAAMTAASHPLVATVPCDSPFLPKDLLARLHVALVSADADLAIACTEGQLHPVFCLGKRELLPHLSDFLAGGNRQFRRWYSTLNTVEVAFDDVAGAFENINFLAELAQHDNLR